jgi:peptidoglycan/xylan/chitin deacetylase (PgdA/CDA1 family)
VEHKTYVTTSWDDGHPLDMRLAELLTKYGLRGTFYVPETAETETMTVLQIRELSRAFEIGGHTRQHIVLTRTNEKEARREIIDSKSWIEHSTGKPCVMFCPPHGKYSDRHVQMIAEAGYLGLRSVELVSLDFPRLRAGIMLLPTTVQAYPHDTIAFAKNAIKRGAFDNLWRYVLHGRSAEWPQLARALLLQALKHGGVFHLWGHSWELQRFGQWQRLEEVLRLLSAVASQAPSFANGQLSQMAIGRA